MDVKSKSLKALKWSTLTELVAKLVTPISNMILARILSPEAFGVMATVIMVSTFAEMISDGGFHKYIIQKNFKSEEEKYKSASVAFWTNISVSLIIWILIALFSKEISGMIGNQDFYLALTVACLQIPINSISSIYVALYKRDFNFKFLFKVRVIGIFIPFLITIPLAVIGLGFWSLIAGNLIMYSAISCYLLFSSEWMPNFSYEVKYLKKMVSFSSWTILESITIWLVGWIDIFLISQFLNEYYLGIYRISISTVNAVMSLLTASLLPVIFSTLSRIQNDDIKFKKTFYESQKKIAYVILPIGVLLYTNSELFTSIMLGENWIEASPIIGVWGLTSSLLIFTSFLNSEVYRSKGMPKISFFSQVLHLMFLVPACLISIRYGFWELVYTRSLIRIQGFVTGFIFMKIFMDFPIIKTLRNITLPVVLALIFFMILEFGNDYLQSDYSILIFVILSPVLWITLLVIGAKKDVLDTINQLKSLKKKVNDLE